jgi:hypothetical protein
MQELTYDTLVALQGGRDVPAGGDCARFLMQLTIIVGVGVIAGGMLGFFTLGLAMGALRSESSPC